MRGSQGPYRTAREGNTYGTQGQTKIHREQEVQKTTQCEPGLAPFSIAMTAAEMEVWRAASCVASKHTADASVRHRTRWLRSSHAKHEPPGAVTDGTGDASNDRFAVERSVDICNGRWGVALGEWALASPLDGLADRKPILDTVGSNVAANGNDAPGAALDSMGRTVVDAAIASGDGDAEGHPEDVERKFLPAFPGMVSVSGRDTSSTFAAGRRDKLTNAHTHTHSKHRCECVAQQ